MKKEDLLRLAKDTLVKGVLEIEVKDKILTFTSSTPVFEIDSFTETDFQDMRYFVDGRKFLEILSLMPGDDVRLIPDLNVLRIEGEAHAAICGINYSASKRQPKGKCETLNISAKMLKGVSHNIPYDDPTSDFVGIYIYDTGFVVASVSLYGISIRKSKKDIVLSEPSKGIRISGQALVNVCKIMDEMTLQIYENLIRIQDDHHDIRISRHNGDPVPLNVVEPRNARAKNVNRDMLRQAVKLAGVFCTNVFVTLGDVISIKSNAPLGECLYRVPCESMYSDPVSLCFSSQHLYDAVSSISTDNILLKAVSAPMFIYSETGCEEEILFPDERRKV